LISGFLVHYVHNGSCDVDTFFDIFLVFDLKMMEREKELCL